MSEQREILFRGKRTDNKQWIEGSYFKTQVGDSTVHCIIPFGKLTKTLLSNKIYQADPATVGQYTGLKDKNGRRIFEGDVVRTQPFLTRPYSKRAKEKRFIGVVEYKTYTFKFEQAFKAEWIVKINEELGDYRYSSWGDFWKCEVIGNIHDNPELLEVQHGN